MATKPYCGNCHRFLDMVGKTDTDEEIWICDCAVADRDLTKDPNCHNSHHEHHDPESPIVLSSRAVDEMDEAAGHEDKPFFETIDELDGILEEANQQVEVEEPPHPLPTEPPLHADCLLYGHVWVRVGTVKDKVMDWGPPVCLRCRREGPEELPPTTVDLRRRPKCRTCDTEGIIVCPLCGRKEGD